MRREGNNEACRQSCYHYRWRTGHCESLCCAVRLAQEGAQVTVADDVSETAEKVAKEIEANGGKALVI